MHKPTEPSPLRFSIRGMVVTVPQAVIVPVTMLVLLAFSGLLGLATSSAYHLAVPEVQPPLEQRWTAGTGSVATMTANLVRGELPRPDPRQRKPPCAEKIGEEAINGWCWLQLAVRPPCPKDPDAYAWEHNGKCYAYALRAAGLPTSGESRPLGVAEP